MVVVDRFSKRVFLIPTWKTASSEMTAELFFKHVVRVNGAPLEIVSDRDPKFTANFWRALWARMGTSLRLSSSRSQATDGQTERAICVVEEILRTAIDYKQVNWCEQLPAVEFAINNTVAAGTGMSPIYLETGRHALLPIDIGTAGITCDDTVSIDAVARAVTRAAAKRGPSGTVGAREDTPAAVVGDDVRASKRNRGATASCSPSEQYLLRVRAAHQRARDALASARTRMSEQTDSARRSVSYVPGDSVWLSAAGITLDIHRGRPCRKLTPVYYGPYRIVEQISPVSYRVQLPKSCKIHDVFHVSRLKLATENEFKNRKAKPLPPIKDDEYEVESIEADRIRYGHKEYLVRWKGYGFQDCNWIRDKDLRCPIILKNYLDSKEI